MSATETARPKIQIAWRVCATGNSLIQDIVFGIGLAWWRSDQPERLHAKTFPLKLQKRDEISWTEYFDEKLWTGRDLWSDEYLDWFQKPTTDRYYCRLSHLYSDVNIFLLRLLAECDAEVVLSNVGALSKWVLPDMLDMNGMPVLNRCHHVDVVEFEKKDVLKPPWDDRLLVGFNGNIQLTPCPLHPSCAAARDLMRYRCLVSYDKSYRQTHIKEE